MLIKIVFIVTLLGSQAFSDELECLTGPVKYWQENHYKKESYSYCTDKTGTQLISSNCRKRNCEAMTALEKNPDIFELEYNSVGNPGFLLCYKLNGRPNIIEFKSHDRWVKLNWCYFESDRSFVDVGTLIELLPIKKH